MMVLYPIPQLMQVAPTPPSILYGVDRQNRGYAGPTVRVRRASDSTVRDCYSQADIIAFCAGTNGFVGIAYDQTGNGRDLAQGTNSKQPKVYDSVTGLVLAGKRASLSFVSASQQNLLRASDAGFGSGNVAFTIAYSTSAWAYPGTSVVLVQVGPDTSGALQDTFYTGRNGSTTLYTANRGGSVVCTQPVDPTSTRHYAVVSKAAGANYNTCSIRQNKVAITPASSVSGTLVFSTATSLINWGAAFGIQQYCTATSQMMAAFTSQLTGQSLDDVEAHLEASRAAT